jgi:DNA polymerase-3 subunit epsilon
VTLAASSPPPAAGRDERPAGLASLPEADAIQFAVVDVETTGLDPTTTRVLECAVVELAADGNPLGEWTSLVSVPGEGELGASWLHGITRAMLAPAPPFRELVGELTAHLAGRVVIGHVLDFDLAHLAAEYARCGLVLPDLRRVGICTRELARSNLPPGPRSLVACCRALGVSCPAAHTALGDARSTAAVFAAFLRIGAVPDARPAAARAAALAWPLSAWDPLRPSRAVPRGSAGAGG